MVVDLVSEQIHNYDTWKTSVFGKRELVLQHSCNLLTVPGDTGARTWYQDLGTKSWVTKQGEFSRRSLSFFTQPAVWELGSAPGSAASPEGGRPQVKQCCAPRSDH